MTKRRLRWLAVAIVVSAGAFVTTPVVGAHAATTAVTRHAAGTPGLALARTGTARAGATTRRAAARVDKGARRLRPAGARSGSPARAQATAVASAATGRLLHNFNGVSSLDSAKTNFGAEFEPPDQGLCVGNGFVLEPVNSAYRVYRPNGTTVVGPFNVNDIFNVGAAEFTSDPRCYFDKTTNTWFAIILFINDSFTRSTVNLAVSTSGDPTKMWKQYVFDTTNDGSNGTPSHPGCPCLGDQPTLGIDQDNLYFTTNEFSLAGPEFNGAQIYAVAKADLVALASAAHVVHFGGLTIGGAVAASVQPALTSGRPDAEYFLSSLDPTGTVDNRLGVWAMTHRQAVASGGSPVLSSTVITSEPYGVPPPAAQQGSASRLDAGDDRMQQTQFIAGNLWGELTTALAIPGDPVERAGAAWFDVRPSLDGDLIGSARIRRQGYVARKGAYVLYPALQADAAGRAAMGVTLTGSTLYPSTAYTVLGAGQPAFGGLTVAARGTGPYDPKATRWGDYGWAVLDPTADAVWLANEYIPPVASQTTDRRRNWGTRVIEVRLS